MKVETIYRYPVKSVGGHALDTVMMGTQGIPGDRCWALKDDSTGNMKVGKKHGQVMAWDAYLQAEPDAQSPSPAVAIRFPDGAEVQSTDANLNAVLSQQLGQTVSLWPLLSADQLDHYRRPPPQANLDMKKEMRALFARTAEEPMPDLSAFPKELFEFESPPGTYFDALPLLVITKQSLEHLQALAPNSVMDVRRFRPNLVIDTELPAADEPFPENAWSGKTLTIGDVQLEIAMVCPRCIMTTHGFKELAKDPKVMRALVQRNNGNLGVYARVKQTGQITAGDLATLT